MQHVFWTQKEVELGCRLQGCKGYPDDWKLMEGVSLAAEFPEDVSFAMNPNFPDNTIVPDCPYNLNRVMLVSTRLKEFLANQNLPSVEYLPVAIVDLKGKVVQPPYFVVNPVGTIPLLRLDQCEATMDTLNETAIDEMKRFVIDEGALAGAPPLFRVEHLAEFLLISRELAQAIEKEGFTGARFIRPDAIAMGKSIGHLAELRKDATAQL